MSVSDYCSGGVGLPACLLALAHRNDLEDCFSGDGIYGYTDKISLLEIKSNSHAYVKLYMQRYRPN